MAALHLWKAINKRMEAIRKRHPLILAMGSYDNYSYCKEHCERCPLRSQCTRSNNGRTLQITDKLNELQSEAKENLSTEIGKELMKQRSIQAEEIFGQIKQDQEYDRSWRRKETMVKLELLLVSIGHNLRKYHTHKMQKQKQQKN